MKLLTFLLALLPLLLCSCTTVDLGRGTYNTWGNSTNVTLTYRGNTYHHDTLNHSAIWDASGRFVGSVAGGVAETLLSAGVAAAVRHGAVNGVQLLAAIAPTTVRHVVTRPTNRATPVPVKP